ncbi:MAG TPA: cobalamin-dependent protein [Elusimicrobiota bacterium]|nr:cobalamin-dependent protein [Elusimicrobiota bacterium]
MDELPGVSYDGFASRRAKIRATLVELSTPLFAGVTGRCLRNWAYRDKELSDRCEIEIAVFNHLDPEDAAVEAILRSHPNLIGISCYLWSIGKIRLIVSKIKERLPTVKIVLGGPEVMHEPGKILTENPGADWVACAEEGEEVLRLLLRSHVLEKRDVSEVPGLAWRGCGGGHPRQSIAAVHRHGSGPACLRRPRAR